MKTRIEEADGSKESGKGRVWNVDRRQGEICVQLKQTSYEVRNISTEKKKHAAGFDPRPSGYQSDAPTTGPLGMQRSRR